MSIASSSYYIPAIDFDKSISIIKEILSQFDHDKNIIINHNMIIDNLYSDSQIPFVQNYKHKLRITTIEAIDSLQSIRDLKIEHIESQIYSDSIT